MLIEAPEAVYPRVVESQKLADNSKWDEVAKSLVFLRGP